MISLRKASANAALALSIPVSLLSTDAPRAQDAVRTCKPADVIPINGPEPAARLVVNPPLTEPLMTRGVVVISYCADHMRLTSVFGEGALAVSPRVGHIHVTVDHAPWHWADASGNPLILRGLPPGPHTILIELVDGNHGVVDKGTVTFEVPRRIEVQAASEPHE